MSIGFPAIISNCCVQSDFLATIASEKRLILGGQHEPDKGGQDTPDRGGQLKPEWGGLYDRILHPRHPLYKKHTSQLQKFDMTEYIETIARPKIHGKGFDRILVDGNEFK